MTVPAEYQRARDDFYAFLVDVRDQSGLWSTHVTYTVVQGVFQAFRRRLTVGDALAFANILPVGLRALFVADWDPTEPIRPFGSRAEMTEEVRALRSDHNFAPGTAIQDVAVGLRRHVDDQAFAKLLARLPDGAAEFWRTD